MPEQEHYEKADELITKRLPKRPEKSCLYMGPDFYGCVGTGSRPTIMRSGNFTRHAANNKKGFRYVVGPDLYVGDAVVKYLLGEASHKTKHIPHHHRYGKTAHRWTCYFFKNLAPARKKWRELLALRIEENRKVEAEHEAANEKARSSDPATAIEGLIESQDY